MTTLEAVGPLHDAHGAPLDGDDATRLAHVGLADLSSRRRFGVKGPAAQAWLADAGLRTPDVPNRWARSPNGSLVARLGLTEFAVVDLPDVAALERLTDAMPPRGVYPVARFDADLLIAGPRAMNLFRETCAFDVALLDAGRQQLAMTSMVGVGVTLLACEGTHGTHWRLWCDGTYGAYLWHTLCEVAGSMGGGAVGLDALGDRAR